MGHRKFCLIVRKNQERKKYERQKLVVSIPKTKIAAPDIFSLEIQLLTSNALSHPWTLTSSIDDKLDRVLLKLLKNLMYCGTQLPYGKTSPGFSVLLERKSLNLVMH